MGLLDDPTLYYTTVGSGPLRQGDLVLAPSATLYQDTEIPAAQTLLAPPLRVGTTQHILLWQPQQQISGLSAEVRWGLAMVLPHECAISRDFNRRQVQLRKDGFTDEEARKLASGDPALDPTVVVSPVIPMSNFPRSDHASILTGSRIGLFPVCPGPRPEKPLVPQGVVDLGRASEISRQLIYQRVARLSERARAVLRSKLVDQWAYRNLSLESEIAKAIGRKIVDARVIEKSKDLEVILELDDGTTLVLKQDQRRPNRLNLPPRDDFQDRSHAQSSE
jgi:hypothetical protein